MFCALRDGTIEKALFIGGSDASKLASSTSMLGVDSDKIAVGGWNISKESVDVLLPELQTLLATLLADTPIIIFALDNSSFMSAAADGSMSQLKKVPECGKGFHAAGDLVVAPDRSLLHPISSLTRIVEACGEHLVFIVSPIFRFVLSPCCTTAGHMSNFTDPDFIKTLLKGTQE
jgi:hypothetical protein